MAFISKIQLYIRHEWRLYNRWYPQEKGRKDHLALGLMANKKYCGAPS